MFLKAVPKGKANYFKLVIHLQLSLALRLGK